MTKKTEGDFNAYLTSCFTKMRPAIYAVKTADKYKTGLSDFLLFSAGQAVALETKFIKTRPKDTVLLLKHPFSPSQRNFFKNLRLTGTRGFGLIGIKDEATMYLFPEIHIPPSGNWKTGQFFSGACPSYVFPFNGVGAAVDAMFGVGAHHDDDSGIEE